MLTAVMDLINSNSNLVAPAGFWQDLWFGDSGAASSTGDYTDGLFMWLWWFCVIWFVGLMGVVAYFVVKYRRRPGVAPQRSPSHNTVIEVVWTVVPTLFLVYIFFAGFHGYLQKVVVDGNAEQIDVRAYKWAWEFRYPNGMTSAMLTKIDDEQLLEYPVFVVPEDYPVALTMTSDDVIHSFWVPDLRQKFDVFPNRYTKFNFTFEELTDEDRANASEMFPDGFRDHTVFCAEYCGDSHSEMVAVLRVASRKDYEAWKETGGIEAGSVPLAELGGILYKVKGCAACHSVDGSPNTGPTWQNVWGYDIPLADGSTVPGDANYLRESILVPGAKIHEGYANQMPSYQGKLNSLELASMIAYIRSLSDRTSQAELDHDKQTADELGVDLQSEAETVESILDTGREATGEPGA